MAFLDYSYFSNALGKQTAAWVLLPEIGKPPYPVMYLLHGYSDDHTIWLRRTSIERYAANTPAIIVMPDGGHGFYTDAAEGYAYGKAIGEDLVDRIDRTFHTKSTREGRCIAGLSMGGYGAFHQALTYPDRFCAAHSFSGAVAYGHDTVGFDGKPLPTARQLILGDNHVGGPKDLFATAEKIYKAGTLPHLRFDCGVDDFLIEHNRRYHAFLESKKIPHEYEEFPGEHNWEYWDEHITDALKFFEQVGVWKVPIKEEK
jgi:putative tributyrin esterase